MALLFGHIVNRPVCSGALRLSQPPRLQKAGNRGIAFRNIPRLLKVGWLREAQSAGADGAVNNVAIWLVRGAQFAEEIFGFLLCAGRVAAAALAWRAGDKRK